jgi:hypothetical protein
MRTGSERPCFTANSSGISPAHQVNSGAKVLVLSTVLLQRFFLHYLLYREPRILISFALLYTVKKGSWFSRPQPGCHLPNPPRTANLFYIVWVRIFFIKRAKRIKQNLPKNIITHLQTHCYICIFISFCDQMP